MRGSTHDFFTEIKIFWKSSKSCRYSRWRKAKLENMRLSRNSSSLLCQKKRACSQVSDLTAVVTHFLQSKISWSTSSSSTDGRIHPMKTILSRDIWSDASRCHRINLHDIRQGTNHMTHFHQCKDWSSSWRPILMYWIFSKYANFIEYIMSRSNTNMIVMFVIIHRKNWIRSIKKQVSKNCLFCLVITKITCPCHVWSGSVMTTHSDTWFRKRIGGIDFTRRRFAFILSMYVQHPRPGVASSVCHRVYLWKDFTNCRVVKSIRAFQIRWSHQEVHDFQTKRCRHILNFTTSESGYLRRVFTLHSDRKRWVMENALNYCPVSCDVHLTSGTPIRSLRLLYDRLIVYGIGQSSGMFALQSSKHVK